MIAYYRFSHLLPAILVFFLSAIVMWLSFTEEPAESFLFPRVISVIFIFLASWNLIRAFFGFARVGEGISVAEFKNFFPGLAIMFIYVFFLVKFLGFYAGSTIAFFSIYSLYDASSSSLSTVYFSFRGWTKRIIITAVFMIVVYSLFFVLLQVQTPKGIFF